MNFFPTHLPLTYAGDDNSFPHVSFHSEMQIHVNIQIEAMKSMDGRVGKGGDPSCKSDVNRGPWHTHGTLTHRQHSHTATWHACTQPAAGSVHGNAFHTLHWLTIWILWRNYLKLILKFFLQKRIYTYTENEIIYCLINVIIWRMIRLNYNSLFFLTFKQIVSI